MAKIDSELRARIDAFVAELTNLVKQSALESVSAALGSSSGAVAAKRGPGRPKGSTSAPKPAAARRGRAGKRTPEEVAKVGETVAEFIKQNPGQGVEGIGKALGLATKELQLPILRLLETKAITSKGQRRGTKYFPASGGKGRGSKKG